MTISRETVEKTASMVAEYMANINEAIAQPAMEASAGYRRGLEESGFSPTIAEHMAAQYHVELLKAMFAVLATAKPRKP